MNVKDVHIEDKPVSAIALFRGGQGGATAIRIMHGQMLKEHVTQVPAFLLCIEGNALFENENGIRETLMPGDFISIEPMIKHWVNGVTDVQLILFK